MMRLSQGQLNVLTTCPRKFQHIYLDQLATPITPEQQAGLTWGSRFHLLMQQRELGLPLDPLPAAESAESDSEQLWRSVAAFVQAAPELFQSSSAAFRESEHRRSLNIQGYLITVIYDLLILEQQAQILDWKTYPRPEKNSQLASNWQTRLYPFVLAETSKYEPDQISMTYWFIQAGSGEAMRPQPLQFRYSASLHQKTQQDLALLLGHLTEWLNQYEAGEMLPQVDAAQNHCDFCTFAIRCQRGQPDPALEAQILDFAEIQEVTL